MTFVLHTLFNMSTSHLYIYDEGEIIILNNQVDDQKKREKQLSDQLL